MRKRSEPTSNFMAAVDLAGEKISEARKRLTTVLDRGREFAGDVRDKAVERAEVIDQTVRENPYYAIAGCVGLGVAFGYFIARRFSRRSG